MNRAEGRNERTEIGWALSLIAVIFRQLGSLTDYNVIHNRFGETGVQSKILDFTFTEHYKFHQVTFVLSSSI